MNVYIDNICTPKYLQYVVWDAPSPIDVQSVQGRNQSSLSS